MIFNFDDIVRINGGQYKGSTARIVGRQDPCTEESDKYMVEIVKGANYYATIGVWVEVYKKHMEFIAPGKANNA